MQRIPKTVSKVIKDDGCVMEFIDTQGEKQCYCYLGVLNGEDAPIPGDTVEVIIYG